MKKILLLCLCFLPLYFASASVYNIMDFGANGSGKELTTAQIQSAINKCHADGGGMVYVPKGDYLVGTLNLKSNVEFHFETGAMLVATTDLSQYQQHNDSLAGVFYTEKADNVSITGNGKIFGQGMEYMTKDPKVISGDVLNDIRQKQNFRKVESGIGDGPLYARYRYHQMIIFSECTNVTLTDFTCIDSPYWTFLIVHCNGVRVSGLTINNNLLIPNGDGLDINSSSNVNVSDCIFLCGDDAIVLAGYAHHYGDPGYKNIIEPSRNINISNCIIQSRSSGIRIGGWDQNHMSNYNFNNITIYDSNRGINISVGDYGSVQNLNFTNIRIETRLHTGDWWGHGEPIKITAIRGVPDSPLGIIKNIHFTNITCVGENAIVIYASDESKLENISFNNFDFVLRKSALEEVAGGNFDFRPNTVPGKSIFKSDIPIVYIENAENVYFNQGTMVWDGVEAAHYTHAVRGIKTKNVKFTNVISSQSPSNPQLKSIKLTE